jgi:RimJ/RimL family protein N-acetyltransferase
MKSVGVTAGQGAARVNPFGQPIGADLPGWAPPPAPSRDPIAGGRLVELVPMRPEVHAEDLWSSNATAADDRSWTYLPAGPFATFDAHREWIAAAAGSDDPLHYAVVEMARGRAVGMAAYLRIMPASGSIEVGWIHYSPALARTAGATEAMYLMMRHAFSLGYRRYEWKCDSLNEPSRAAARRLGFTYEGTFRQATVYKGRTRDTAWFSILDSEWPRLRLAYEQWLDPANFDAQRQQRARLSELTVAALRSDQS